MSKPTFDFKLDDTAVQKSFAGLARGVKDFSEPLQEAGREMLTIYGKDTFNNQGATGERWKPLSADTLLMRSQKKGHYALPSIASNKILVWTGALMNGFAKAVTKTKLTIDNSVDYFKYHQERGGKTPQRRMLYLNAAIIVLVADKVHKYTEKIIKK